MVTLHLESASVATSTEITLGGFLPSTTYHKYEDDYHNHLAFTTYVNGNYTYTQDLSQPHLVFIQPRASTIFLDDITGWTPSTVGTWDAATRTGTLSGNVTETIQIDSDNITLDGNGHYVTGSNTGAGVFLNGRTGVTIKNLKVKQFYYGLSLISSSGNTLSGNTASNNYSAGIVLHFSSGNTLSGNTASNNSRGISLWRSSYNKVYNNNFINNTTQAYVSGGSDNAFNLAKPTGGNYWSNWTIPDNDGDGFVDNPYLFSGDQDNLPWTAPDGWLLPQVSSLIADPNPASVGSPVTLTATVDDSATGGSNIAFAEYRIDDGQWTSMTAADGAFDSPVEDVTATTAPFAGAGVYNIDVRGQDAAGNYSLAESILLAVYDPDVGFVTGGGWIDSPAGAYTADPSLTGKATFGFVSRYQRGATTPSGRTGFQFRVANLTFHSDSYQWLVVAGASAQYKGVGTINGEGNYGFMLTAIDGQINGGGGSDKFRIKIWDRDSDDAIVYDSQIGEDDGTAIGGGNIVINER